MGSCSAKVDLPNDLVLEISSSPDPAKKLLELNLHYGHYSRASQLKIDQLTASALAKSTADAPAS